ncbi:MAG: ABC transporter ATP-binding protein [Halanaerobium sp.]|nr:ABC transporter ATP-binding protein [Halanaerobium sp.]
MPSLEAKNITKQFGGLVAVKDLCFTVDRGEILGIIGPNGAGKTTVINLIAGTLRVTGGNILFQDDDVTELAAHERNRLGISRTFQTVRPLSDLTAIENIMVGALFGQGKSLSRARLVAEEICDFIKLEDYNRSVENLTVLELKKIELGRALASDPELLFLDEIMAGLNSEETWDIIELVKEIQKQDVAICVVEHVMRVVKELTDRVIVLDRGQIIAQGPYGEVSQEQQVIAAYLGEEG